MAGHQTLRMNLASAIFPFSVTLDGRDVISAGEDMNYNYIAQLGEPIKDRGIPQALYMHNVIPTVQGYQSVAWEQSNTIPLSTPTLDSILSFSNVVGSTGITDSYMSFPGLVGYGASTGFNFGATGFTLASSAQLNCRVTQGLVNGANYVFFGKLGLYSLTNGVLLTQQTPAGLNVANIQGICAAQGYLIAYDYTNNVVWSNMTNPLDFVPAIATGAGGGSVQQVKGIIQQVIPIAGGFIMYCSENIVSATYTGNSQFPFAFKEIQNGGGIIIPPQVTSADGSSTTSYIEQVAYQDNLGYHYAWTAGGLQQVDLNQAQSVFPEATEFLAKQIYEDFNESTQVLTTTYLTSPLRVKLAYLSNRYLIISYGQISPLMTQALVYDTVLARWGKLKKDHVRIFDYNFRLITVSNATTTVTYSNSLPIKNICISDQFGNLQALNVDLIQAAHTSTIGNNPHTVTAASGVLIIGKVQYKRNNWITHQWTGAENLGTSSSAYSTYLMPTLDGKTFLPAIPMSTGSNLLQDSAGYKRFGLKYTCQNFSLLFQGSFNLVSLIVDFTLGGFR